MIRETIILQEVPMTQAYRRTNDSINLASIQQQGVLNKSNDIHNVQ